MDPRIIIPLARKKLLYSVDRSEKGESDGGRHVERAKRDSTYNTSEPTNGLIRFISPKVINGFGLIKV